VHTKTEASTHDAVKTPKTEITHQATKTQGKEYKGWKFFFWGGGLKISVLPLNMDIQSTLQTTLFTENYSNYGS